MPKPYSRQLSLHLQTESTIIVLLACSIGTTAANATIITRPDSLNVGDQYRLVFITLAKISATSSDIAVYDAFVTAQANTSADLADLGTIWNILGSTQTVDAKVHTSTDDSGAGLDGFPIFRLDGIVVANNYDDLWDGGIRTQSTSRRMELCSIRAAGLGLER